MSSRDEMRRIAAGSAQGMRPGWFEWLRRLITATPITGKRCLVVGCGARRRCRGARLGRLRRHRLRSLGGGHRGRAAAFPAVRRRLRRRRRAAAAAVVDRGLRPGLRRSRSGVPPDRSRRPRDPGRPPPAARSSCAAREPRSDRRAALDADARGAGRCSRTPASAPTRGVCSRTVRRSCAAFRAFFERLECDRATHRLAAARRGVAAAPVPAQAPGPAAAVAPLQAWVDAFNSRDPRRIAGSTPPDAVFWGTTAKAIATTHGVALGLLQGRRAAAGDAGRDRVTAARVYGDLVVAGGAYTFSDVKDGVATNVRPARFTFVFRRSGDRWLIVEHHSSRVPE